MFDIWKNLFPRIVLSFGGGGGGSQQSTSSTKVEYSPEEAAARNKVMNEALGIFDQTKAAGPQAYPGARPVGSSGATLTGQQMALDAANTIKGGVQNAQNANNFGLHDALFASSNPYLQDAMDAATRPLTESFGEAGGPLAGIRSGSVDNGSLGGSRQGIAEGLASKALINKVGDIRSTMSSNAYAQGLQQMNDSIKNQGMLSILQQMPSQIFSGVGAQQEAQQQQGENFLAAQRDFQQNSQWAPLQNLANIIYGGSNGTTSSVSSAPKPDTTMQGIGTLGSLAMMAMML